MSANKPKIFISYKRDVIPDDDLAGKLYDCLNPKYDVFRDQESMTVGEKWAKRIQQELSSSDFFVTLLSKESLGSEMVRGEIEQAHKLQKQNGYPHILPVRVAYKGGFERPLSIILDEINWAYWESEGDTEELLVDLEKAINGGVLPINVVDQGNWLETSPSEGVPAPSMAAQVNGQSRVRVLEAPGGTMVATSDFYVVRDSDEVALNAIANRQGVTIPIKGPRQVGKSSLLIRTMTRAREVGKRVVFLDFQLFDEGALTDADDFFRQFCTWITYELGLEDRVEASWKIPLGNSHRCTRYLRDHILKELNEPLVLAMDEVERVFPSEFRSDFFSMLRSWHNERAITPQLQQLDLVLVTSTEPYQLIDKLNQSPFNVGEVVEMKDFNKAQVDWLNQQHGAIFSEGFLEELSLHLHGHPYLTRRAMYLVADGRYLEDELIEEATEDDGPFGDHLKYHFFRMHAKKDLVRAFLDIIKPQ